MKLNLPEKKEFTGPATMWKRILAFVLDLFVLDFFVFSAYSKITEKILGGTPSITSAYKMLESSQAHANAFLLMFMLMVMMALAYFTLLQYMTGQTLGHILFNIRVVSDAGDRKFGRAGLWQCLLRNIFMIPAAPFILLWIIDPLYLLFARKGQRLTEWLSKTRMIEQFTI